MSEIGYKPEVCECCGQTKTYIYTLSKGTVQLLKQFARAIGQKGINCIHVHKELLAGGWVTANQRSNIACIRAHGLVAKVKGANMRGNYLLTKKGSKFLHGHPIPKYAIISKAAGHQIGCFEPEKHTVTINDIGGEYWEGINYEVVEGEVIHKLEELRENLFTPSDIL